MNKAANSFWPERCRHAGRVASPIETTEDRAFQTESVGKLDDVAAAGSLLSVPHDGVGNEAGWAEPASVRLGSRFINSGWRSPKFRVCEQ